METRFMIFSFNLQVYVLLLSVVFTGLGVWIAHRIGKPKIQTVVLERTVYQDNGSSFEINQAEIDARRISKRELEVLQLIASGKSNQEIADQLFVSVATIKTHTANLFEKLEAKRRTQLIENARNLRLIRSY